MAADGNPVETKLRAYVNELVHQPLKRAGYRRNGRVWRSDSDGVVRVVDLQRERKGSSISFTLNVGVAVPGYYWYLCGFDDAQPDASLGVVSGRIGYALDPPRDVWFVVDGGEGLRRIDWSGMDAASDGVELLQALTERVVPTLAQFSTPDDVLAYLGRPEPRIPFLGPQLGRDPEGMRAVIAWRASGSVVPSVGVAPLGDSGVRVEAPPDLAEQRPDLVETMVEAATPVDDAIRIRNVVSPRPGVFEIQGGKLRPERMKSSYERFLAVRRFGATPPRRPSPMWLHSGDDEAELDDVSVETAEDGDEVLVTFSDEVAHEHVDLVEQCLDRCRAFPGVQDAHWQDRELLVLRGAQVDQRRLQHELLGFVRSALAGRSVADSVDDS